MCRVEALKLQWNVMLYTVQYICTCTTFNCDFTVYYKVPKWVLSTSKSTDFHVHFKIQNLFRIFALNLIYTFVIECRWSWLTQMWISPSRSAFIFTQCCFCKLVHCLISTNIQIHSCMLVLYAGDIWVCVWSLEFYNLHRTLWRWWRVLN